MNLGRSEYYVLKEKERDLNLLLEKFKHVVKNFEKFDWTFEPFMAVALGYKDAKMISDIHKKYSEKKK